MEKYRVTNRITSETKEVVANSAQEACEKLGWMIGFVEEAQC
jgi:hypothetical protein